jgi:hypothetical protein
MAGHARKFELTLAAIEGIIRTNAVPPLRAEDMRSPDERLVLLENVRSDLRLAARALRHLHSALVELRDIQRVMFDPASSHRDRLRAFETSHDTSLDLELSIREVYELSYAVQELAMVAPVEERPPTGVMRGLGGLSVFRGELLVHKRRAARFMRGARIGTPEELDLRIGVAIQPISDQDASQLNAIFARAAPNLPPELRAEVNWNERLQHLAENPDCVLPPDRGELRRLIARNGIKSASPLTLARVILRLVEHYFAPDAS